MTYSANHHNKRQLFNLIQRIILPFLLASLLLISCSNRDIALNTSSTIEPSITPTSADISSTPAVTVINPCEILQQQIYQDIFADTTLIFSGENGSCRISNQWETKSIQVGVFQDDQANKAVRWYTSQLILGWNKPDLIAYLNQLQIDGAGLSIAEFQQLIIPFYERIDYRNERIFSIGDTTFWYTYPLASVNILDLSINNTYLRISLSGFFAEQALPISLDLADRILKQIPEKFLVDYQFELPTALGYSTPTVAVVGSVPAINLITLDKEKIFFGDLCGDEITTITAVIDEKDVVDNVYLVYRLISSQETNSNWVTLPMERKDTGYWKLSLSAESDFSTYKVVSGAQVEYAISIIYNVSNIFRSPTYNNLHLNQCVLKN